MTRFAKSANTVAGMIAERGILDSMSYVLARMEFPDVLISPYFMERTRKPAFEAYASRRHSLQLTDFVI